MTQKKKITDKTLVLTAIIGSLLITAMVIANTLWVSKRSNDATNEAVSAVSSFYLEAMADRRAKIITNLINNNFDEMEKAQAKDELSEGDLEDVAGGVLGIIVAGAALGTYAYIKRKGLYIPGPGGKLIKIGGKK